MKALKWINTAAFAAMIAVNALANLLPIGGNTTAQVAEAYPNLFAPAPITFAIWGLIYIMLAVFTVYQWGIFDKGAVSSLTRKNVGIWFAVSCALNIAWVFLWHYRRIGLSMIAIVLLLGTLMLLQRQLKGAGDSFLQRFAAKTGFSVYYGWIIAASLANLAVLLTKSGWNGWGLSAGFWTSVLLLGGAAVTGAVVLPGQNRVAGLAVMWAYAGILIRHISPAYFAAAHPVVIWVAFVSEAVILIAILTPSMEPLFRNRRYAIEQEERAHENA